MRLCVFLMRRDSIERYKKTKKPKYITKKIDKYCKIYLNDWKNAHGIYAIRDINDDKIVYIGQTRQTFQKKVQFSHKKRGWSILWG